MISLIVSWWITQVNRVFFNLRGQDLFFLLKCWQEKFAFFRNRFSQLKEKKNLMVYHDFIPHYVEILTNISSKKLIFDKTYNFPKAILSKKFFSRTVICTSVPLCTYLIQFTCSSGSFIYISCLRKSNFQVYILHIKLHM